MRKVIVLMIVLCSVFVFGCSWFQGASDAGSSVVDESPAEDVSGAIVETETVEEALEETAVGPECVATADCPQGEQCIDESCGKIADLYETEGCSATCNFNGVEISTSDGEELTLNRGKGSYTYAGALEWKLLSGPDYCSGSDVIVPVKLIKKNAGKVLEEQVVTLGVAETSDVITHPTISKVAFTLEVKSVEEVCE